MNSSPLVAEAKNTLTIPLLDLMGSPEGWGQVQGEEVAAQVRSRIEACPSLVVQFSLQGILRTDASFAGELVRLAANARMRRGFCLIDLTSLDLRTFWQAAAIKLCQPLFIWNDGTLFPLLGPSPSVGVLEMLEYVQRWPVARTSEAATALHLKVPNAMNPVKGVMARGVRLAA